MSQDKTILKEFLTDPKAVKEARLTPLPTPAVDRSLSFIRSLLVLDVPMQTGGMIDIETKEIIEHKEEPAQSLDRVKKLAGIK